MIAFVPLLTEINWLNPCALSVWVSNCTSAQFEQRRSQCITTVTRKALNEFQVNFPRMKWVSEPFLFSFREKKYIYLTGWYSWREKKYFYSSLTFVHVDIRLDLKCCFVSLWPSQQIILLSKLWRYNWLSRSQALNYVLVTLNARTGSVLFDYVCVCKSFTWEVARTLKWLCKYIKSTDWVMGDKMELRDWESVLCKTRALQLT